MIPEPTVPYFNATPHEFLKKTSKPNALSFIDQAVQTVLEGLKEKTKPTWQVLSPIYSSEHFKQSMVNEIVMRVIKEIANTHPNGANLEEENCYIAEVIDELEIKSEDFEQVIEVNKPSKQSIIIEYVKLQAKRDAELVSICISLYHIDGTTPEGQKGLIEIAKVAAKKNGWLLAQFIKNYGIDGTTPEGQKGLIEIAKIAVKQNGESASCYIQNFGIKDKKEKAKILLIALINNIDSLFYVENYELDLPDFHFKNPYGLYNKSNIKHFCELFKTQLPSLLEELKSIHDEHSKKILGEKVLIFGALFLVCKLKEFSFEDIIEQVNELNDLRNPSLRSELGKLFISQLAKGQSVDDLKNLSNSHKELTPLTSSCLWSLQEQGANSEAISALAHAIQNKKVLFKDTFAKQKLFQAMMALVKDDTLPINNKLEILQFALKSDDKKSILRLLGGINSIYLLVGNLKSLEDVRSEESFDQAYLEAFQLVIPIKEIQNFSEKFEETFEKFRNTAALFTYAATLNKLPEQEKAPLLEKLAVFVSEVLEGTLSASRYETEHLKTIFATNEALKEKWTQGAVAPFAPAEEESEATKLPDFKKIVETSLREGHHGNVELPFLQGKKTQKELIEASKSTPKEEKDLLNFQIHLIKLTQSKDSKHALSILNLRLKDLPEQIKGTQLESDIQGWRNGLAAQSTKSNFEGWTMTDSDDPCDLLLCGTEVEGSCQRVDGRPSLNKCLLAYLLDGKNRLITIKNESGAIKARSVLRLLFDGENPVLFLERIYPTILDDKKRNSLIEFAKSKAKNLGLPLLSTEVGSGEKYGKEIRSLGGPAPFEYVDAGDGVMSDSIWSISDAHVL